MTDAKGIINLKKAIVSRWNAAALNDVIAGGLTQRRLPDDATDFPYAAYQVFPSEVVTRTKSGSDPNNYFNDVFVINVVAFGSEVTNADALIGPIRTAFDDCDLSLAVGLSLACDFVNDDAIELEGREGLIQYILRYRVMRRES